MSDVLIQDTIVSTKSEVYENIEPKQDVINENLQVEAVLNPYDKKIDAEDAYVDSVKERANIAEHHKNLSEKENLDNRDNIEITGTIETNLELEMMRDNCVLKDKFEKDTLEKDHVEKIHVEKKI